MTGTEVGKYKIVIVDDEPTAIDALRQGLEFYDGVEVVGTAGSGGKGKKLILDQCPDLLFLDVELPDITGIDLLGELKEGVDWNMKVVFYTSHDKYMLQALRESAFDFLLKPFSEKELHTVLDRFLKTVAQEVSAVQTVVAPPLLRQGVFMISTVTGFKLLRLDEIGFFEYLKDKRQWQVVLFNQSRLNLKRNTKAEDIVAYSSSFVQISQSAIVNINYLAMIDGKRCLLYPPFHEKGDLIITRGFLKELQDRFFVL